MGIFSKPKAPSAPPPPPPTPIIDKAADPKKKKVRALPDTMTPAGRTGALGLTDNPNTSTKTLLGQ
jgi:hypothetical protein